MTNAFESAREKVRNSASSIFSKTDVLQLLIDAESQHNQTTADQLGIEEALDQVSEEIHTVLGHFDFDQITSVEMYDRSITLDFDVAALSDDIDVAVESVKTRFTAK